MNFQWLSRSALWLLGEWFKALIGIAFVVFGLLPSVGGGLPSMPSIPYLNADILRVALLILGLALLYISVMDRYHSYEKLSSELRIAAGDLASENLLLRLHAIEEILTISRRSRRLHGRCMRLLTDFLKVRFPAQHIKGRRVLLKTDRREPAVVDIHQEYGTDRHQFVANNSAMPRRFAASDAMAAVNAVAARRHFFDDPRQWIHIEGVDLPSISLDGLDLRHISFAGCNLRHANFERSNLSRVSFAGADLVEARFGDAEAKGSSFAGVIAHQIHLDGADLRGCNFWGADLYRASMQNADARGAKLGAHMWGVSAGMSKVDNADFFGADLSGAQFQHAVGLQKAQIFGDFRGLFVGVKVDKNTTFPWSTAEELQNAGVFAATAA